MNLKGTLLAILATALVGCSAKATEQPVHEKISKVASTQMPHTAPKIPNPAIDQSIGILAAIQIIQSVVKDPAILKKNWEQYSGLFPGCTRAKPYPGEIICPPLAGLIYVAAGDGPLGVIDFKLKAPVTCEGVYEAVRPTLGKGKIKVMSPDKCDVEWILNPSAVKKGHASLYTFSMDSNIVIFQMAIDQGP